MVKSIMYKTILFVALDLFYVHRVRQHAQPLPEDAAVLRAGELAGHHWMYLARPRLPTRRNGRSWAQWGGRPTGPWAPPPSGSTWLSPIGLLCQFKEEYACFPAEERVAPPYIYMRGGAPFSTMEEMEDLHHHYKLH